MKFSDALQEFEAAWVNPDFTRFELPPVRVNQVLDEKYIMEPSIRISRKMVWDMELKKAWDPLRFIPYVVSEGKSWGRHEIGQSYERFSRASVQAGWITSQRGQVLEDVFLDHLNQRILFLGRNQMQGEGGSLIASGYQPLFHVEHGVGGTEEEPLNLWRIVVLTKGMDERFTEPFKQMVARGMLPGFLEIYIEQELKAKLNAIPVSN